MLQIVVIHVDDEFGLAPKKRKKVVIDVNCKFQEIWIIMKCCVYTKIKGKEKSLIAKWDFIEKQISKRKGSNGKRVMDPKCMHVKNEIFYG